MVERGVDWPPPGWGRLRQVHADDQAVVYESTPSLPRAYLVEDAIVASDATDAMRKLTEPGFDLRRSVVVDAAPVWPADALAQEVAASVAIVHAGAEEVRLRVATPRPALLVLTDLHWPGWRATVNGEVRPILRANASFRAIPIERSPVPRPRRRHGLHRREDRPAIAVVRAMRTRYPTMPSPDSSRRCTASWNAALTGRRNRRLPCWAASR